MEWVHVGMPLVSPFSTLFHPVSSYLDTTFSPASYPITNEARNIFALRFGEIKNNSFVSVHGYATGRIVFVSIAIFRARIIPFTFIPYFLLASTLEPM